MTQVYLKSKLHKLHVSIAAVFFRFSSTTWGMCILVGPAVLLEAESLKHVSLSLYLFVNITDVIRPVEALDDPFLHFLLVLFLGKRHCFKMNYYASLYSCMKKEKSYQESSSCLQSTKSLTRSQERKRSIATKDNSIGKTTCLVSQNSFTNHQQFPKLIFQTKRV